MERLNLRRHIAPALALSLAALSFTACGNDPEVLPNRSGTVTEHQYDDPDLIFTGKVFVPTSEQFFLKVEQCDRSGDEFADERGCVTTLVEVDEETYTAYPDGSQIIFSE